MTSADMVHFADAVDGRSEVPALLTPATVKRMTAHDRKVPDIGFGLGGGAFGTARNGARLAPAPSASHNARMGLPRRDHVRHTYADYLGWTDDSRYELVDGAAFAMGPAPTRRHQEVLGELFRQVAAALQGKPCRAYIAPFDVRLPRGNEADDEIATVVQPDLSVICDRAKLDERGCRGAPDWIVEVLSPTTAGHDHIAKRQVYERAGVREYWLVHPGDALLTVYTLLPSGEYGRPAVQELVGTTTASAVPGVIIDWAAVLRE